jgi:hypothetical protein
MSIAKRGEEQIQMFFERGCAIQCGAKIDMKSIQAIQGAKITSRSVLPSPRSADQ